MSGKWDIWGVISLCVLLITIGGYELYLYELFYGTWEERCTKGLYYVTTALSLLYLTYFDTFGNASCRQFEFNLICKLTLIINFIFFALILYDILPNHRLYLYAFNGTILVVTMTILFFGCKHGIFKD